MKLNFIAFSDIHGDLPVINGHYSAAIIAGDILPLSIQRDFVKSIAWFSGEFVNWCNSLDCEKVFLVAGNHDFMFENIIKTSVKETDCSIMYAEENGNIIVDTKLLLPEKIVYMHDSSYTFHNVKIYGTPWCPELKNWAFYGSHDDLERRFAKIPKDLDILVTHSPGYHANHVGMAFELPNRPDFGSKELTNAVKERNIRYWVCGHVHSGNHEFGKFDDCNTLVANVSYVNEEYRPAFKPLVFEVENGETIC